MKLSLSDDSAPPVTWRGHNLFFWGEELTVGFKADKPGQVLNVDIQVANKQGTLNKDYWIWVFGLLLRDIETPQDAAWHDWVGPITV